MKVSETEKKIIEDIVFELRKAQKKHPVFPYDTLYQLSIMMEEAGEAVRAGNNYKWENGSIEDVKTELRHTAAMCLRCLEMIESVY